jgi:hypothetical protein
MLRNMRSELRENIAGHSIVQTKDDPGAVDIAFLLGCQTRQLHKISHFYFFPSLVRFTRTAIIFSRKAILFRYKSLTHKNCETRLTVNSSMRPIAISLSGVLYPQDQILWGLIPLKIRSSEEGIVIILRGVSQPRNSL